MIGKKSPLLYFFITVTVIALLTFLGPEEKSLGSNVRIVYLHGAWVMAAEAGFIAAAFAGLLGLVMRREIFHAWSAALGRTGIVFWVTYLLLSLIPCKPTGTGCSLPSRVSALP